MNPFTIIRLNSRSFPISGVERETLAAVPAEVISVEQPEDCERFAQADAVMVVSAYLRQAQIDRLQHCRIIARMGNGTDKIDIEAAAQKGILVTNVPDFCTEEVADHTMALLLTAARQLHRYDSAMRQGKQLMDLPHIRRLSRQTLGIIGFGKIGQAVARRARSFGMRILVCDPQLRGPEPAVQEVTLTDKETILEQSDYVALLCPLTAATKQMIKMDELRKMKPTAVLVNTARGELVDENALAEALRTGVIRYAALDVFGQINVFAVEGFSTDHPFFKLDNVLLTPHVAAFSEESMVQVARDCAQSVVDVLSGVRPQHIVNPEVFDRVCRRSSK